MVDKKLLKIDLTSMTVNSEEIPETDAAVVNFLVRDSAGNASLYGTNDTVTTSIELGTGPNIVDITIGNGTSDLNFLGNLDINGDLATSSAIALLNKSVVSGTDAAYAIERGLTGDDTLLFWNETSDRFELGFAETSGGASLPSAPLGTFADLKVNNLLLDSTAITADGALAITADNTAFTSDLSFSARGATIALNDASNLNLDSLYTATSVIGALNEVKNGDTEINGLGSTYTNGEATAITRGQLVYVSTTDTVMLADASSNNDEARAVGAVVNNSVAASGSAIIGSHGLFRVRFESGLTLTAGQEIFLSASTAGSATNVSPSASGNIIQSLGTLKNLLSYDGSSNLLAEVQLIPGTKSGIA